MEEAISRMRNLEKPQILDMCTGSGCILLSLLLELPQALGTGVDVSEEALCVAKENRKRLGLEQRAELIQSDLFSADYFRKNSGNDHMEYDMLISNPPYIRTEDIEGLMEEVRFHDPVLALDGKENGLYFYEKITEQAGTYLKPGGWLMYEIGCDQGMDVSEIMKKNGFEQIEIKKTLPGWTGLLQEEKCRRNRMFDKLEDLLVRFEEVLNELGEPGVTDNQERFQKLMKEQSELQPIVDAYKEYKDNKETIQDSLSMLEEEKDEEMREMLKEELSDAKKRVEELEKELKILLYQKIRMTAKTLS